MKKKAGKASLKSAHQVLKRLKKQIPLIILSLAMALVTVISTLYVPIVIGDAIDLIIGEGLVDLEAIGKILLKLVIIIVVTGLAQWLMNVINNKITYRVTRAIRNEAISRLSVLPLSYIDSHSSGDTLSRIISDVDTFADGLLMGFTQFFTGVLTIIGTLCFMFAVNIKITLVVVLVTPVSFLVASFIAKKTHTMFKLQSETRGAQTAFINEMIEGQKVVAAYGHSSASLKDFDEINDKLSGYSLKATFFSSLTNPSTRFVNSLVYAGVAVAGALTAIATGGTGFTVGQLSCFLSYSNQYTKPFNEISGVITELQNALACADRVFELIDELPEQDLPADACSSADSLNTAATNNSLNSGCSAAADNNINVHDSAIEDNNSNSGCSAAADNGSDFIGSADSRSTSCSTSDCSAKDVTLRNVCFSYVPDRKLIENLNLTVKPGQRIAIVGPTGCGKTTLINLLMRFYDVNSGSITIGGTDIKNMSRKALRSHYGMVLQETWLKSGTIRDNIVMGNPDATDEEVIAAAKATHAHSFIKRLPNGYDTLISEDGGNLSQGQKQLLCITRVMLIKPPMLILDEATSSIDTRTELRVQEAFGKLMEGRTSFIVAHRLSTVKNADCILVMKDGSIIEQGTHDSLLALNGFYKHLYESQFAQVS